MHRRCAGSSRGEGARWRVVTSVTRLLASLAASRFARVVLAVAASSSVVPACRCERTAPPTATDDAAASSSASTGSTTALGAEDAAGTGGVGGGGGLSAPIAATQVGANEVVVAG